MDSTSQIINLAAVVLPVLIAASLRLRLDLRWYVTLVIWLALNSFAMGLNALNKIRVGQRELSDIDSAYRMIDSGIWLTALILAVWGGKRLYRRIQSKQSR